MGVIGSLEDIGFLVKLPWISEAGSHHRRVCDEKIEDHVAFGH
jgi:hypothetical protein